ncbi:tRNA 2-thiouridine(34) synthase MnmA [Goodfellowiella coeruleoviolacea]|uniref:tRNA-specific 2-thiouridylase MnmA n=1 Tax=Goodfellowiella coeruleoviolacea TaxID=334858 RepID=A0AAE3GGR0_9PSEU|nr:tRNA 2-thiouridine(34) synthase MnmA [Goodfellowiella coeruleoviolacea]MCP2167049.1 tRNA-specific 2-thiouridylase [Goodfellowiella coeruleoviolacea]
MRVLAAMSGGVDSAVAAARAVDAGHDVVGVHLALSAKPGTLRTGARGCCTVEDAHDARRAADLLGIPFYVWDFAERFTQDVIEDFVAEYSAGRTPNPCLRCNERIKFEALLDKALALGFDAVCTGHYARLSVVDGRPQLRRSADAGKDQSYVLASLTSEQLRHSLFPLGDSTKTEVRAEAAERGLAVAEKPDSHDICFIPDGNTRKFLTDRLGEQPGVLVDDETGEVLGEHSGVHGFTVGQRKGLGIQAPAPSGRPRYVLALEPVTGTVRVGGAERLSVDQIVASRPVWPSGEVLGGIAGPVECVAQVRAHGGTSPAVAELVGDQLHVRLREPLQGVAPGQAVALYRPDRTAGDLVLGSATITTTR